MNKNLLQTPEDEIDLRQICIKDLIMLAEAKEHISVCHLLDSLKFIIVNGISFMLFVMYYADKGTDCNG